MNDATYNKLEFDVIRRAIAGCCGTGLGKRLALVLSPSTKATTVRIWLDQVRELTSIADEKGLPPLGGVHDVRDLIHASAFPAPLEADALARVAETLAATVPVANWCKSIVAIAPSLGPLGDRIDDLSSIAESINESIDARGHVVDHASGKLASIRAQMQRARDSVHKVFDRVLRQANLQKMLQYSGTTFHRDRRVLPLKSEHRGRIPGIIHRSSDTGATLFVEPAESVELNNRLVRLADDERNEITRILKVLTQLVHANAEAILRALRVMGILDLVAGKVRYAKLRRCVCPAVDDNGVLDLRDARHPVLVEVFREESEAGGPTREVVAIDVRLGDDFDVLVITGPNTGGKTVALKTVGLVVLMAQCGLPVPAAEGSRVPIFTQVFIDIGDEQSLQQSLSTFSSHLATQVEIIEHSGPKTLVLVDELGAGTDPDEGAAIGRAILVELLRLKSKAVVTTHLSALKAAAFDTARVDNASVEFNPETLEPTYRLRIGEPGNSRALIIAKRLGLPERIIKTARGFLDNHARALDKAISGTLQSRRDAEQARRAAHEAAVSAQQERDRLELRQAELEDKQNAFDEWTQWINTLSAGDIAFVKTLGKTARVVRMELHRQRALVSAGAMDIEVPLRELRKPTDEE